MKSSLAILLAIIAMICGSANSSAAEQRAGLTIKQVTGGRVQGEDLGDLLVFKGIPFAAPPTGANRWREPQPVAPWKGVRSGTSDAPACMQPPIPFGGPIPTSEDCLYLNVWAPKGAGSRKLPVMVWIYGGGFKGGATRFNDGAELACKGVVVVNVAYRVGLWGDRDFVIYYREGLVPAPGIVVLGQVRGDVSLFDNPNQLTISLQASTSS